MNEQEIISLIVTFVSVFSFCIVFTVLYHSYQKSAISDIEHGKKDIELIDEVIYEKQDKTKNKKKFWGVIKSVLFYALMIVIIPIFVLSFINKIQGNTTMIGNHTIMVVATGSMSEKHEENDYLITNRLDNQFDAYSIIVLDKVENPTDLNLYDVIAFKDDEGKNVIHRIKAIYEEDGVVRFETRGDANDASDEYHPSFEDIIGKYSNSKVDSLGMFVMFFQSAPGIITILSLVYCLIMVDKVGAKVDKAQDDRLEHLSHVITQIDDSDDVNSLKATYKETIYYKGFAYHFDEKGFVDKTTIKDKEVINKTEHTVIKITENKDESQQIDEIVVDKEN